MLTYFYTVKKVSELLCPFVYSDDFNAIHQPASKHVSLMRETTLTTSPIYPRVPTVDNECFQNIHPACKVRKVQSAL